VTLSADIDQRSQSLDDIRAATTALLIVDMSRDFIAPGALMECEAGRNMVPRLIPLLERCRAIGLPVVYVNHVHRAGAHDMGTLGQRFPSISAGHVLRAGTPGVEIWDEIAPRPGDLVVEKIRQSGFTYTSLEAVLRDLQIRTVIVGGVATGACVDCTARDAVSRDFDVIFLSDGTATPAMPNLGWGSIDADTIQRVFLTNFAFHFGRVATIRAVIGALSASEK
jgi:nicotinamidase-related amidase